jgi:epoxyqueuosine reductase
LSCSDLNIGYAKMLTGSSNRGSTAGITVVNRQQDAQASGGGVNAPPVAGRIRLLALEAGFTEAGVVGLPYPETERDAERFAEFVDAGRAGSMAYLARQNEAGELVRSRVGVPFPWAKSVVVCLAGYNADAPLSVAPAPARTGWIARYAWSSRKDASGGLKPSDYHKVLLKRLRGLEEAMRVEYGEFEAKAYVDTGPVVERPLAKAAGLGWTGKNTCLIHPKLGSWNFLAVLVTSLELPDREAHFVVPDRCGSCTRCIEACPTDALFEPYRMDARRCISYLTIEHRGAMPEQLMPGVGRQIFGCDICQDVCPWNRKAPITTDTEMMARPELINPDLGRMAAMDRGEFEQTFNGSPVRRAGFEGFQRNLAVAMGNSGQREFVPILERWAGEESQPQSPAAQSQDSEIADAAITAEARQREAREGLQAAARWALHRLANSAAANEAEE